MHLQKQEQQKDQLCNPNHRFDAVFIMTISHYLVVALSRSYPLLLQTLRWARLIMTTLVENIKGSLYSLHTMFIALFKAPNQNLIMHYSCWQTQILSLIRTVWFNITPVAEFARKLLVLSNYRTITRLFSAFVLGKEAKQVPTRSFKISSQNVI